MASSKTQKRGSPDERHGAIRGGQTREVELHGMVRFETRARTLWKDGGVLAGLHSPEHLKQRRTSQRRPGVMGGQQRIHGTDVLAAACQRAEGKLPQGLHGGYGSRRWQEPPWSKHAVCDGSQGTLADVVAIDRRRANDAEVELPSGNASHDFRRLHAVRHYEHPRAGRLQLRQAWKQIPLEDRVANSQGHLERLVALPGAEALQLGEEALDDVRQRLPRVRQAETLADALRQARAHALAQFLELTARQTLAHRIIPKRRPYAACPGDVPKRPKPLEGETFLVDERFSHDILLKYDWKVMYQNEFVHCKIILRRAILSGVRKHQAERPARESRATSGESET